MTGRVVRLPGGRFAVPGNRWDLVPEPAPTREPFVSVVVPYYQNRAQLDLVLEGLARQDYPADRVDVVVVDDGSPEPLVLTGDHPRTRVLRQENRGFRAAAARNLGASVAGGELLCFLDQDTVPGPAYLRRIVRLPSLVPDALVVGRRRHVDLQGWTPSRLRSWLTGDGPAPPEFEPPGWLADAYRDSGNLLTSDDTSYRFVISAVMACSAALFRELGGFDQESFTRYGGEDWELAFRAYNAGAVLAHEPAAVAWHDGPDWAERGDPGEREAEQAEQQRTLARLLPDAVRWPRGEHHPGVTEPVDLIVSWTGTASIEAGRLAAAARSLLDSKLRPALYLDPGERERCGLEATGVLTGRPAAGVLARALDLIELHGDGEPTADDLSRVRDRLRSGDVGRVLLHRDDSVEPALIGLTVRASRRAARWQPFAPETDLLEALFGSDILDS